MFLCCLILLFAFHLQSFQGQTFTRSRVTSRFHIRQNRENQIRLTGGHRANEGNVEIYHLGRWGSICDDEWDQNEAKIVCRTLGYENSYAIPTRNSRFGESRKLIWMDNLYCDGTERSLSNCQFDGWKVHDCSAHEAAGVICDTRQNETSNRSLYDYYIRNISKFMLNMSELIVSRVTQPIKMKSTRVLDSRIISEVWITGGRGPEEGRVEVRLQGSNVNYTLCGDGWSLLEAAVICRHVGQGYGQFATVGSFTSGNLNPVFPPIHCTGRETSLAQCNLSKTQKLCTTERENIAGVICSKALPDLIPDEKELQSSVYLEDRQLFRLQCAMEENCLSSKAYDVNRNDLGWLFETRRLLRFTARIGNFGTADFLPFLPKTNWQWHSCHRHYHSMEVFAHFDVVDQRGQRVAEGHKASFCLEDNQCLPGTRPKFSCKNFGDQGISVGCIDTYLSHIDCQWIDMTDVPRGLYMLKVSINPEFKVSEISFDNNAAVCSLFYNVVSVTVWNCSLTRP